jgi:lipopolysaccharide biosynthesis regulator YciM
MTPNLLPAFVTEAQFWLVLLPALACAFMLGLVVRLRPRASRGDAGRGLGSVLNLAADQAIATLSHMPELKPDTVHTYMALGSLFRARGEFDRATKIHHSILERTSLPAEQRIEAMYALGVDYAEAGIMNRAEEMFRNAAKNAEKDSPARQQALTQLAALFERQKRWDDALRIRAKMSKNGTDRAAHAHLLSAIAEQEARSGHTTQARLTFGKALAKHPGCLPARTGLAELYLAAGAHGDAQNLLADTLSVRPELFHLQEALLLQAYEKDAKKLDKIWRAAALHPQTDWRTAAGYAKWLVAAGKGDAACAILREVYATNPRTVEIANALSACLRAQGNADEALAVLQGHLEGKAKSFMAYQCRSCGYSSQKVFWHCPQCQKWDKAAPLALSR